MNKILLAKTFGIKPRAYHELKPIISDILSEDAEIKKDINNSIESKVILAQVNKLDKIFTARHKNLISKLNG